MRPERRTFSERVSKKAARRQRARRARRESPWLGLGLFGLVGWSVVLPALLGLALGRWLDAAWPGHVSWTLTLLLAGVLLGCANAWQLVARERRAIERLADDDDGDPEERDA